MNMERTGLTTCKGDLTHHPDWLTPHEGYLSIESIALHSKMDSIAQQLGVNSKLLANIVASEQTISKTTKGGGVTEAEAEVRVMYIRVLSLNKSFRHWIYLHFIAFVSFHCCLLALRIVKECLRLC